MNVLAIDPGYQTSAWLLYDGEHVVNHAIEENAIVLDRLTRGVFDAPDAVVLEHIESFGMPVGRETLETVFWTGRFFEAALRHGRRTQVDRLSRKMVKVHLCQSTRATDSSIRVALMDRFGGSAAKGTKANKGPLYGLKSHAWSALAIAVTWWDLNQHTAKGVA